MARCRPLRVSVLAYAALALASATLLVTSGASFAAPKATAKPEARAGSTKKTTAPEVGGEVAGDALDKSAFANATLEDEAACLTARKKLFVEGQGWIVRRVTTCR